jgi:nitroimidazol reductase NimA-like FMN-containing flavoprotein (pyridoxamine 5'-phosphate oxidase superfamily)
MIPGSTVPKGEARLVELSRADCLRLLATGAIGRVVFTDRALPAAHPVTYLLDQEEIVFRTASGAKVAAASLRNIVAFQVDQIDVDTHRGWSVLGIGEAHEVTDPERLVALAPRLPQPWSSGAANGHIIGIPLQRLTGRQFGP